jgi:lysophospholipase L1-like esterase
MSNYEKQNFVSGQILKAEHLNHMEDGIGQLSEEIEQLKGEESIVSVAIDKDGLYIQKNGDKGASNGFAMYTPVWLSAGDKIRFTAQGYAGSVSVLSIVPTTGNLYTAIIIPDDSVEREYSHTATVSGYYVISSNKKATVTCYKTGDPMSETVAIVDGLQRTVNSLANNDVFAFVKVGVIGDSLASGASNYKDSSGTTKTADRPAYSWGKYIEREHGIPVTLFSTGGASTRSWLSSNWGKAAMQSAEPCDCYIIGLGVNDKSLGADYVGTIDDVIVGNEGNNADTFYGNYSGIIAALIEKSPRCKIFCLNMPSTQTNAAAYNYAIGRVAQLYNNAHLIDLYSDDYFGGSEYTALWNVAHSTAAGYKAIADHLWKRLNAYMRENLSEFTDIQWILENHD